MVTLVQVHFFKQFFAHKFLLKSQLYSKKLGLESDHYDIMHCVVLFFSRAVGLMAFDHIADLGF